MKTEKDLQNWIKSHCSLCGVLCHKLESKTSRGWPDLVLIHGRQVVFVEVKSPAGTGRLHPLQVKTHKDIRAHGGIVEVVDSKEQASSLIGRILTHEIVQFT